MEQRDSDVYGLVYICDLHQQKPEIILPARLLDLRKKEEEKNIEKTTIKLHFQQFLRLLEVGSWMQHR